MMCSAFAVVSTTVLRRPIAPFINTFKGKKAIQHLLKLAVESAEVGSSLLGAFRYAKHSFDIAIWFVFGLLKFFIVQLGLLIDD